MIQRTLAGLVLGWTLLASAAALAGGCPAHYVDGRLPEIRNPKLSGATRELCYGVFGVMHSGVTRTPLWSAEKLRAANVRSAGNLSRINSFHAETRLPRRQRAELADYARSGYDRGHMAPNGDMPDRDTQQESFTLANMVPQDAAHNRRLWSGVEGAVRKMAKKEGTLYVITGPAFIGPRLRKVGNVLVPTHLYKVVYSPKQRAGGAWLSENSARDELEAMSIAQLEKRIGIDLLPSLTGREKAVMLRLPKVGKAKAQRWQW